MMAYQKAGRWDNKKYKKYVNTHHDKRHHNKRDLRQHSKAATHDNMVPARKMVQTLLDTDNSTKAGR
jgi:hypothetical protein